MLATVTDIFTGEPIVATVTPAQLYHAKRAAEVSARRFATRRKGSREANYQHASECLAELGRLATAFDAKGQTRRIASQVRAWESHCWAREILKDY